MRLSVIITCYNAENTIARAIDSVLLFGVLDMEVIIVDDGSTDKSPEIIDSYKDKRIRKFLMTHYGMMETYLFAFGQIRGDYFTFCDCDDHWFCSVKKQLNEMKNHNFTVTRAITMRNGEREYMNKSIEELQEGLTFDNLLRGQASIFAQTYMINTNKFREIINFHNFLKFNVWDYPIVLRWIKHEPIKYLDMYTAYFTIDGESVTNTNKRIKRLKYILGYHKIKWSFILKYGCKFSTITFILYKFARDIYSVIFKRWNK